MSKVIVVGGGLAGLSAANTVVERGGRVILLDKNPFLGGNSTKATSGINAALTRQQVRAGIPDSVDTFLEDTASSAKGGEATDVQKVLVFNSAPAVDWLTSRFGLNLDLISRLGGHSHPRTHRGPEKFPGMTITYALMEKLEDIAAKEPERAQIIYEARADKLITDAHGTVIGVEYVKDGKHFAEHGPVVIATGGYAADFGKGSLLEQYRPDLLPLPTTNGDHCTGDGIRMSESVGAKTVDMEWVQVHPTGLVHPDDPAAKIKFLAAEALRGVGGLLLNAEGKRFVDELEKRDYVTGEIWKDNKPPYRLVLNSKAAAEIEWHIKHYVGRGLMRKFDNAAALAKEMGVPASRLQETFEQYNEAARTKKDPFGKKYFHNMPCTMDEALYVSWIVPVVHYCMGGVQIGPDAEVISSSGKPIQGLFAAGEVTGGVHGLNRLGGSSLLDCVVFGRVSGESAARYLFQQVLAKGVSGGATKAPGVTINVEPSANKVTIELKLDGTGAAVPPATPVAPGPSAIDRANAIETDWAAPKAERKLQTYTMEEVAKHNTESDCWVVVHGQVLDVTKFMSKHPGGKQAILLYAGKDATAEFDMLHKPDVIEKYAAETVIGTVVDAPKSKL